MYGTLKNNFKDGDEVYIGNLGDHREYRGIVCGIHRVDSTCDFYIVELVDRIPGSDDWTCVVIIESCLRKRQ